MVDGLSCRGPGIDTYVVPCRIVGALDGIADCGDQTPERGLLSSRQGEEISLVSPRYYEGVPWAEWKSVWKRDCAFVLEELTLAGNCLAEDTHGGHIRFGFAQRYHEGAYTVQDKGDVRCG